MGRCIVQPTGDPQIEAAARDEWAVSEDDSAWPASADVVIVGGGIVGCSAALTLARRGVSVALLEKGRIGGEQSGRNWGWIRQQGRSPLEIPLMKRSLQLWSSLSDELHEDVGFYRGGSLYLARTPAQFDAFAEWLPTAREFELDTRMVSGPTLAALLSGGKRWRGAMFTASDARAEPHLATRAIARGAKRAGAQVFSHCAVEGVDIAAGRVAGVVTKRGRIRAPIVVCAAGAWSRLFCERFGANVPQLRVKGTVARLAPSVQILDGEAWSEEIAIRRRRDGGYTVAHGSAHHHSLVPDSLRLAPLYWRALWQERGAARVRLDRTFVEAWRKSQTFENTRVLHPEPDFKVLREIRHAVDHAFPELAATPLVESWAGMIEVSPDVLPILSSIDTLQGAFVATGFSGHGFGLGPGAGEFMADLVTGGAKSCDLAPFRLTRFFDGSPIRPGPTI